MERTVTAAAATAAAVISVNSCVKLEWLERACVQFAKPNSVSKALFAEQYFQYELEKQCYWEINWLRYVNFSKKKHGKSNVPAIKVQLKTKR